MAAGTFREWLGSEIQRQDITRRALARRLASKHPQGVTPSTIETYRRAIYKYLDPQDPTIPSDSTRLAFAEALGVDPATVPGGDEEDDPVSHEVAELLDSMSLEEILAYKVRQARRKKARA